MEIFEDLSYYCQPKSTGVQPLNLFQNSADELNTPEFEKAPFDYVRQSSNIRDLLNVTTLTEDPFNYNVKSAQSNIDNVYIENNLKDSLMEGASSDIASPSSLSGGPTENYLYRDINSNSSNNIFYPSNSGYEDIYYNSSNRVTPTNNTALINEEDEYLPTVSNCSEIYLNNSNSGDTVFLPTELKNEYLILQTTQFETPENSSASECSDLKSPPLKLKIGDTFKHEDIDTPHLIDTIASFENDKLLFEDPQFNIFNFIMDKDAAKSDPMSATTHVELPNCLPSYTTRHRPKSDDDSDEDYEPPGRKRRKMTHSINEDGMIILTARRGRPPKPKETISTDEYCGESTGKYREMRDKNNEASRKSRLKRKEKERELEDEANLLHERNIKLKAQVQELEKTVTNFRTNLMQILLKR